MKSKVNWKLIKSFEQRRGFVAICGLAMLVAGSSSVVVGQEKITFDDHIKPVLRQRCAGCHNPSKKNGDLDVTNYTNLMLGGGSGEVIAPGDVGGSYLFALVNHDDEPAMPPDSPKIPEVEIDLLRQWIELGALETKSSKARMSTGPKVAALAESPLDRPALVATPAKLSLEPRVVPERANAVLTLHSSPWAPYVACGGPEQIQIYSSEDLRLVGILPFPEGTVNVVRFSRNGSLLMAAGGRPGAQGIIALFDVVTGDRLFTLDEEVDAVLAADLSPDQQRILVGGPQKMIRVYSTESEELLFEIKKHTDWITAVAFSPDGVLFATADRNGGLHVWESFTGREYLTLGGHGQAITSLTWRPDSNVLSSASEDGTIKLWEMENGGEIKSWSAHGGGVLNHEFTRDGRMVSTGRDRVGKLFDQSGNQIAQFDGLSDVGTAVTHCDETNRVVVGDWLGHAQVFAADGKVLGHLEIVPPRLDDRLSTAQRSVEAARSTLLAEQATYSEIAAKVAASGETLGALQGSIEALEKENSTARESMLSSQAALKSITKELEDRRQVVIAIDKELPALAAAEQAMASAAEVRGDSAIGNLVAEARMLIAARKAQKATVESEIEARKVRLEEERRKMESVQALLAQMTQRLQESKEKLPEVLAADQELRNQLDQQAMIVGEKRRVLEKSEQDASYWQSQLGFVQAIRENREAYRNIRSQLDASFSVVEEQENLIAELSTRKDSLAEQLEQGEQRLSSEMKLKVQLEESLRSLSDELAAAQTRMSELKEEEERLAKGLKPLREAIQSAKAALELNLDDAELAAAIKQLEQLESEKVKQTTALMEQAAVVATDATKISVDIDSTKKALESQKVKWDAALKQATELRSQWKGLTQQLETATTTLEAGRARISECEAELQRLDQEKLQLQGVPEV